MYSANSVRRSSHGHVTSLRGFLAGGARGEPSASVCRKKSQQWYLITEDAEVLKSSYAWACLMCGNFINAIWVASKHISIAIMGIFNNTEENTLEFLVIQNCKIYESPPPSWLQGSQPFLRKKMILSQDVQMAGTKSLFHILVNLGKPWR